MARPNNAETGRSTLRPAPWTATIHSVGLVLVVLLAAGLRFHDLDRTSLWLDEAVSWQQASQPFLEMIAATARDNYPPLHNIILHVTIALFGDGETALRAPSALLGVANVYVLYLLGSALWDRTTGLIAALLLTVSGFHVWYSTEARMYALLAFTATLFVLTVVYATRRPNWLNSHWMCSGGHGASLQSRLWQLRIRWRQHRCADGSPTAQSLARCGLEELGRRTGPSSLPFPAMGTHPVGSCASWDRGLLDT